VQNEFDANPIETLGGFVLHNTFQVPHAERAAGPTDFASVNHVELRWIGRAQARNEQHGLHAALKTIDRFAHSRNLKAQRGPAKIAITIQARLFSRHNYSFGFRKLWFGARL